MYLLRTSLYLLLLFCNLCIGVQAQEKGLLIVHTNDIHSQIDPFYTDDSKDGTGGFLRREAVVDSLRRTGKAILLVDAGDAVQGTPYFTMYHGRADMALINRLGYDVITPGNHEFDNGTEALAALYQKARPEIVNCNYDVSGTPLDGLFKAGIIKEIGGVKIGILGVGTNLQSMVDAEKVTGIGCRDGITSALHTADSLRACGAELIIVLSHMGIEQDTLLAQRSKNIDLIVGGHSHTLLTRGLNIAGQEDSVHIVQTGEKGLYLGVVSYDRGRLDSYTIPLTARYDSLACPETKALIDTFRQPLEKTTGTVVGRALHRMKIERPQSALSDFTADVLAAQAHKENRRCDFALINMGAIRRDIKQGPITRGDIMACYPFENRICYLTLRGKEVQRLFDIIAARGGEGVSREVCLVVSPDKKAKHLTIGGKRVRPWRRYRMATTDFVANGGDDMTPLSQCLQRTDTPHLLGDLITTAIKDSTERNGGISASSEKRIICE